MGCRLPAIRYDRQSRNAGFPGGAKKQFPQFLHPGLSRDGIVASLHGRDIFLSIVERPIHYQNFGCVPERLDDPSPTAKKEDKRCKIRRCVPLHDTFSPKVRILVMMQEACRGAGGAFAAR
ncbi:hypothetical protein RHE_CH00231 [Rhizobium etli CFN 42]|uniref:Uncharacterized protein n=1 Tax=Rhizobium etli (strain ATCC 51251 / DSM 11541 / JCM 21823 / NBRC 15573 / CFN 42) TaxID=347834 RepID=Q2KDN1_RHIEC|nr:hypothetical protein RHE_CH00231 [Rhizobium etli CFN 42]